MKVCVTFAPADQRSVEELLERVPYANAHAITRLAARLGLEILRANPERIPELLGGQRLRFTAGGTNSDESGRE